MVPSESPVAIALFFRWYGHNWEIHHLHLWEWLKLAFLRSCSTHAHWVNRDRKLRYHCQENGICFNGVLVVMGWGDSTALHHHIPSLQWRISSTNKEGSQVRGQTHKLRLIIKVKLKADHRFTLRFDRSASPCYFRRSLTRCVKRVTINFTLKRMAIPPIKKTRRTQPANRTNLPILTTEHESTTSGRPSFFWLRSPKNQEL